MPENSPLLVLEGLFLNHPSRGLLVQTQQGEVISILEALKQSQGKEVSLSMHYTPPNPPVIGIPGFGACVYISSCPIHNRDPEYLLSFSGEGVLSSPEEGKYLVGDHNIPILEKLAEHHGRLVLFQKAPPVDPALGDLLSEVGGISDLLKALQREIS